MKEFQVGKTFGEKPFVNHGLYSAEALREVGYVDEKRYFFYHADGDLCLRMIQAGFEIVPCSRSFVVHYSEANLAVRATNMAKQQKDWAAYQDRWRNIYYFEGREESNREVLSPDLAPTDWGAEDYWSDYSPEGLIIAYRKLKLDLKRRIRARLTNGGSQGRET